MKYIESKEFILSLDQTFLSHVSTGKYIFNPKGAKKVSIKGIDDKRQTTATFTVSMTGKVRPIQVIYEGKTHSYLIKIDFPTDFNPTFSNNH